MKRGIFSIEPAGFQTEFKISVGLKNRLYVYVYMILSNMNIFKLYICIGSFCHASVPKFESCDSALKVNHKLVMPRCAVVPLRTMVYPSTTLSRMLTLYFAIIGILSGCVASPISSSSSAETHRLAGTTTIFPEPQTPPASGRFTSLNTIGDEKDMPNDEFCMDMESMRMVMFVKGFRRSLSSKKMLPCLSYYVRSWVLNDEGKFKGAMIYSFLLGLVTQGLAVIRAIVFCTCENEDCESTSW